MSYKIIDVELTDEFNSLIVPDNMEGVAVLLRRKGRPVDFWFEPGRPGEEITSEKLSAKILSRAGTGLISESIKEEMFPRPVNSSYPSLTVAVCTRSRPKELERCLRSLKGLDLSISGIPADMETLVVDNAPPDSSTKKIVQRFPDIKYVCEEKPGLDFARNRAVAEAAGELIAYIDDDVVVDRGWLRGLMDAWAAHPNAGVYTGLVLPYSLDTRAQVLFEKRGGWRKSFSKIVYGSTFPGNPLYPCGAGMFGTGANMAFRTDVLHEIGGFDDALDTGPPLPGGGDLDAFYRVLRAGYLLIYEPSYLVFHEHRRAMKDLRKQYMSWGQGLMAFMSKNSRTDPSQREKFRKVTSQWFRHRFGELRKSIEGRYVLPPEMLIYEIWGGVFGYLGEYERSVRRINRINKRHNLR